MTTSRAGEVRAAAERLAKAHRELQQVPAGEVLDALCRALDLWRDPASAARRALEAALPEATGFGPEMVREGLRVALAGWSGASLRELVEAELGDAARLDDTGGERVAGFETTSVLLAGSIPMPSLHAMLMPLVLRSPVLVKPASRDPVTPDIVASSLAGIDPRLGRCIEVVGFARDDEEAARCFFASPCVVATGSDETLAEVRRFVAPTRRFVAYGHRLSLAVLGGGALAAGVRAATAERIALDVALWDQLGCLSPLVVFVVDPAGSGAGFDFASALADALAEASARWPRGALEPADAAAIASERSEAQMRASLGARVEVFASDDTSWSVVAEQDPTPRPAPLHRFVRVVEVPSVDALWSALRPYAPHLAGVALAGFGEEEARLARALLCLGASRVCAPGQLQAPPLAWPRDDQALLLPMARLGRVEPSPAG